MTDSYGLAKAGMEREPVSCQKPEAPRLVVVQPQQRDARPLPNLARVLGQFAELQQRLAVQVSDLENSLHRQRQDVAAAVEQLPELRGRINWLMAGYYDRGRQDQAIAERISAQEAGLAALRETVSGLCEAQSRWNSALDEIIDVLLDARAVTLSPILPVSQR
jgi:hypothetical protein